MYSLSQLNDIEAIRQIALRYCQGVDRLDAALMKSAYWPDATDDHGSFKGNAHDFCDHCMRAHLAWRATKHCVFNHSIDLDGSDRAAGEIYNVTYLFAHQDSAMDVWVGRYLDVYEKRAGEWRIIERACIHEGTQRLTGGAMAINAAAFLQGSIDRRGGESDPSD